MTRPIRKTILKSQPKWKQALKRTAEKKYGAMLKTGMVLFAGFLLLALFVEGWKNLHNSVWDGKRTFYLAVQQAEDLWLVKISKPQNNVVVGKINGNTMLSVGRGFGELQAKNIYKLGEQEKKSGLDLVKESAVLTFGLPVEGMIYFPKKIDKLNLPSVLIKSFLGFGKTNLTRLDIFRLFFFAQGLRFDQIQDFSFEEIAGVYEEKRPDGVAVWLVDPERLDSWLSHRFSREEILNEGFSWEVVNTTSHSGMADKVGRLLRNTGVQVLHISDGDESQSKILTNNEAQDSIAVKFFSNFLKIPQKGDNSLKGSKSDVVVVLGEDFWKSWFSR